LKMELQIINECYTKNVIKIIYFSFDHSKKYLIYKQNKKKKKKKKNIKKFFNNFKTIKNIKKKNIKKIFNYK